MSAPSFPKLKVPPKVKAEQKKKKKNAPDRPQPTWLFPNDEENPVLNPTIKTEDDIKQERQDRAKSLDYMKRRVHAAPDIPAPPPQLLTLIGIFLTEYGFNSTSRLFSNERKARQALNGWEDALGKKIEKGTPTLEKIYRDWYRDWKVGRKDETSSSEDDSESSSDGEVVDLKVEARGSSDDDSEASSDGFGGSDVDIKQAPKAKKAKTTKKITKKTTTRSSSESSTSDSDADNEEEAVPSKKKTATSSKAASAAPGKPTVAAMINTLKRKAPTTSSDEESSDEEKSVPVKKTKTGPSPANADSESSESNSSESNSSESNSSESDSEKEVKAPAPNPTTKVAKKELESKSALDTPSSDSSEDSESESETAGAGPTKLVNGAVHPKLVKASSDSSVTINGDIKKEYSSATSSSGSDSTTSDSDVPPAKSVPVKPLAKKKHQGAKMTPLAELSAKATSDSHISNQYQPYDYAERAYQDLSVTRGKGFTKEKNKKKRGSYRGGAIDTSGGKGFKFED